VLAPSDIPGLHEGPECLGAIHATVKGHEPGGVLSAMSTIPAPTKDTAGIELASVAKGARTAKSKVLEPWVGDEAGHKCDIAWDEGSMIGACRTDMAPRNSTIVGEQAPVTPALRQH
jgi:hypothetical protein